MPAAGTCPCGRVSAVSAVHTALRPLPACVRGDPSPASDPLRVFRAKSKPKAERAGAACPGPGLLTVPCVILSHLHLLHAGGREPARASFHGSLPEAALPDAEHCRDRSQTGRQWAGRAARSPPPPPPPAPRAPRPPPRSPLLPWKDVGIHTEEKRTDGHSTGRACGGHRDTQMDTLEGGQEADTGATVPLLRSQVTPLLPRLLNPSPSWLGRPAQGPLPRAQGHCAVAR